jgi:hypothetical protein
MYETHLIVNNIETILSFHIFIYFLSSSVVFFNRQQRLIVAFYISQILTFKEN